ncbi:MAG: hypothetical protein IPK19_12620 [Chloroflexi bacterium]|nr:hypothetical protein [Chloroflexota bacterium]
MHIITTYNSELERLLPETAALLRESKLAVHEAVVRVVLAGSRGLRRCWRDDSDIDLTLVVDRLSLPDTEPAREAFLREILEETLQYWSSRVELDTAIAFSADDRDGVRLFDHRDYDEALVNAFGRDSLTIFKTQKGFDGYVPPEVLDLRLIYPLLTIWER